MQEDFHYYATYCAGLIAGYSHEESLVIAFSDNFADCCTKTFLTGIKGPVVAATTQSAMEMSNAPTDFIGLQQITSIWSAFHFLPGDLYSKVKGAKPYRDKYHLICKPNSDLSVKTAKLAKGKSLEAIGLAMHVVSDTWAHQNFAGTPSLVINNMSDYIYEVFPDGREEKLVFWKNPGKPEDVDQGNYINSIFSPSEISIFNLGHGRAGHIPDYSFIKYRYMPAWGKYEEVFKDNPSDYMSAFTQLVYALKYYRGDYTDFQKDTYETEAVKKYESEIRGIFEKRQLFSNEDWKKFAKDHFGTDLPDFDMKKYDGEYEKAEGDARKDTVLGRFFMAAIAQKTMVVHEIFASGNKLAGYSAIPKKVSRRGIIVDRELLEEEKENRIFVADSEEKK